MDIQRLIEDFGRVRGDCYDQRPADYNGIKRFFDSDNWDYSPTITKIGATAKRDLVDFITLSVFPTDGCWLDMEIEDGDDVEKKLRARDKLSKALLKSNFYSQLGKCISNTVLYKRSLMSVSYSDCLSFRSEDDRMIYMSRDTDIAGTRIYAESEVTGGDLKRAFADKLPMTFFPSGPGEDIIDNTLYCIVRAVIPTKSPLLEDCDFIDKSNKWAVITFLPDELLLLTSEESIEYCQSLPVVEFGMDEDQSFAELALPYCVQLEELTRDQRENRKLINRPNMSIGQRTFKTGAFNLGGVGGLVVTPTGEERPSPIHEAGELSFSIDRENRLERLIKEVFYWDVIQQTKMANVSQFEAASFRLNAILTISPMVTNHLIRAANSIIERAHNLLREKDSEYKKAVGGSKFTVRALDGLIKGLEKKVAFGRIAQAAAAYIQLNPSAAMRLDSEEVLKEIATCYGMPQIIKSDEEVHEERKAMAKQDQQMQEAEVAEKQANAQSKLTQG